MLRADVGTLLEMVGPASRQGGAQRQQRLFLQWHKDDAAGAAATAGHVSLTILDYTGSVQLLVATETINADAVGTLAFGMHVRGGAAFVKIYWNGRDVTLTDPSWVRSCQCLLLQARVCRRRSACLKCRRRHFVQ